MNILVRRFQPISRFDTHLISKVDTSSELVLGVITPFHNLEPSRQVLEPITKYHPANNPLSFYYISDLLSTSGIRKKFGVNRIIPILFPQIEEKNVSTTLWIPSHFDFATPQDLTWWVGSDDGRLIEKIISRYSPSQVRIFNVEQMDGYSSYETIQKKMALGESVDIEVDEVVRKYLSDKGLGALFLASYAAKRQDANESLDDSHVSTERMGSIQAKRTTKEVDNLRGLLQSTEAKIRELRDRLAKEEAKESRFQLGKQIEQAELTRLRIKSELLKLESSE